MMRGSPKPMAMKKTMQGEGMLRKKYVVGHRKGKGGPYAAGSSYLGVDALRGE